MARGFLDRKDRSPGTRFLNFSDSTVPPILTHGGGGTRRGRDMSRSTVTKKSSTASSDSGSVMKALSIDTIYRSIKEQERDLHYRRKNPGWVLMSPKTQYELQSMDDFASSVLVYMGAEKGKPALMITGIPVKAVTWMPDGIVVVTDTFMEDSLSPKFFKEAWLDELWKGVGGPVIKGGGSVVPESWKDLTIKYDTSPSIYSTTSTSSGSDLRWTTTFDPVKITGDFKASTGFTLYDSHPVEPSSAVTHTYEENPSAWDVPIVEGEPDPDSIYGKALARAKAAKRK
jgi:hypothetical protein